MLKKILYLLLVVLFLAPSALGIPFKGKIQENVQAYGNTVIDAQTQTPISGARVSLPQKYYSTKTDKDGKFFLDGQMQGTTIMNIEKNGYKPFSLTVNESAMSKPLIIGIEKSSSRELVLESDLCHIGDDNFSYNSANAYDFKIKSAGPSFTKNFKIHAYRNNEEPCLVIGSVIGIDTLMAQKIGQSHAQNAFASAPEVYFNGNKIAEIQINGDNQEVRLPKSLIIKNGENTVTIKAGKNLFQHAYTDYDDIEFMNLYIDYRSSELAKY